MTSYCHLYYDAYMEETEMKTLTYKIVEFDANDVPTVIKVGLTRNAARTFLADVRVIAKQDKLCFRYIMARDRKEPGYDARVGDHLWTGTIREGQ